MIKVYGGTAKGTESLCLSCRHAHNIRGMNHQSETYCNAAQPSRRICFPISSCTIYDNKSVPSLYEMREIAWVIHSRNRGPIGFTDGGSTMEIIIDPPPRLVEQPTIGPGFGEELVLKK